MILEIEREWHQTPGWYATLDHSVQTLLMGWYRVKFCAPPEDRKQNQPKPGRRK